MFADYTDVGEVLTAVDLYFAQCFEQSPPKPPTLAGLAYFLGFNSRQELLEYSGAPDFTDAVSRARLRVEAFVEERLLDHSLQRGAEFILRSGFGWRDKSDSAADFKRLDAILDSVKEDAGNA